MPNYNIQQHKHIYMHTYRASERANERARKRTRKSNFLGMAQEMMEILPATK